MPTAAQVKALIRSHAEDDEERFYSVALQVAAQAARQGHGRFAQELRDVVDQAQSRRTTTSQGQRVRPVRMVQPRDELAGLLTAAYVMSGGSGSRADNQGTSFMTSQINRREFLAGVGIVAVAGRSVVAESRQSRPVLRGTGGGPRPRTANSASAQ